MLPAEQHCRQRNDCSKSAAETKKKIPHDRGKNSAHITTDQLYVRFIF